MTLRTRLTLAVAAIVAVAVLTGAAAAHFSIRRELRGEIDSSLVERSRRFTQPAGPRREQPPVEPGALVQQIDANGRITASAGAALPVTADDTAVARTRGARAFRDVEIDGERYRMLTTSIRGGAVQIARSLRETDDVLDGLRTRLALIAFLGTALAALAGWALARRTTRPIEELTQTTEHIAATQDLTTPIPVTGTDEVGRLAAAFNTMLSALATSRDQQHRLVADASHELRTPLTAIRTNIEFLERAKAMAAGERQALLSETRLELAELTTLVTELVELATDARNDEVVTEVDLASVAEDVAARFRRRSSRPIEVHIDNPALVQGRRGALERAVSNLVDNALKFSDGAVEVTVAGSTIDVADRGLGIPAAERERVFDRFYRADAARTRPGSGLGLSIVAQVAELHGGRASMHERPGGGNIARLALPS